MSAIRVINGNYRGYTIQNTEFTLVSGFKSGARGNYVTVKNNGAFPKFPDTIRVAVDNISDIEFLSGETVSDNTVPFVAPKAAVEAETDEQAITRIRERFDILHEMTKACINGDIRAMIVSGPPGVGKSFGVEQEIEKVQMMQMLGSKRLRAEVVKGSATPIGLYQTLYKYSDPNCVIVFDDCDSILKDPVALNLLKGALDSYSKRIISWNAEGFGKEDDLPRSFEFKGRIVFISNMDQDKIDQAIRSRSMMIDLSMTDDQKIDRMEHIAASDEFMPEYDIEIKQDALALIREVKDEAKEISLRTLISVAKIRAANPKDYRDLATYVLTN